MSFFMELDGDVLVGTLSHPEALNALGPEELLGLADLIGRGSEDDVRAIVLTGSGRAFCAGVDLVHAEDAAFFRQVLRQHFHPVVLGLTGLGKPIVTAVNGVAAGAGVSLALLGDARIGAETSSFVAAFGRLGLSPDAGLTSLAVRAMGYDQAIEFTLAGERWSAARAASAGLLSQVVADESLREVAVAKAIALARAPLATTAATLALIRESSTRLISAQLDLEASVQHSLLAQAGIREYMAEAMGLVTRRG